MIFATAVPASEEAGRVLFLEGKAVRVAPGGAVRQLAQGDAVFEGDTLRTEAASHLQLRMRDDALIGLRPESSLRLRAYAFSGREDGSERALLELMKGAFRSITGAIGRTHKASYRIHSHHTVLGIRGTDHETFLQPSGTYNRVVLGGTFLENRNGRIELEAGQSGFAPANAEASPVRLPEAPAFMFTALPPAASDSGPAMRDMAPGDRQRLQQGGKLPGAASPGKREKGGSREAVPGDMEGLQPNRGLPGAPPHGRDKKHGSPFKHGDWGAAPGRNHSHARAKH